MASYEVDHNVRQAVPFFMVENMERSLRFYIDGLGFELKIKWVPEDKIEWCCLELGKASIMLQEYRTPNYVTTPGEGISIYFICKDALALYRDFASRGTQTSEPFVGNGMWVVGLNDPDGYKIFFESETDVTEGTTYLNR